MPILTKTLALPVSWHDRPPPQGRQPRIDQHLPNRALGGGAFFALIGGREIANEIRWVEIGDILQRVAHAGDIVGLADRHHACRHTTNHPLSAN